MNENELNKVIIDLAEKLAQKEVDLSVLKVVNENANAQLTDARATIETLEAQVSALEADLAPVENPLAEGDE